MLYRIFFGLMISLIFTPLLASERINYGDFSNSSLKDWEPHEFDGTTQYQFTTIDNKNVLAATSSGGASGLVKKTKIDLHKTPFLNWSWRVENILSPINERSKKGDDYAARVYVIVSGGLFFWKTKAVNYVWSSEQAKNSKWPNAYTGNAQMVAVESGSAMLGSWINEKRNVREDLKQLFGEDIRYIDAVALMSDTDNSKKSAKAYYGDIYFTAN